MDNDELELIKFLLRTEAHRCEEQLYDKHQPYFEKRLEFVNRVLSKIDQQATQAKKPPITPPHLYPMCTCILQQPYRGPEHSMHCPLHKSAGELPALEEISHVHSIPKMDDGK